MNTSNQPGGGACVTEALVPTLSHPCLAVSNPIAPAPSTNPALDVPPARLCSSLPGFRGSPPKEGHPAAMPGTFLLLLHFQDPS